jgi:hypothetical protein
MKKSMLFVFAAIISIQVHAQTDTAAKKDINTLVEITNGDYDMGKISIGKALEYNVYIKNISSADTLIIQDVKVGCGCTTPKFKTADKILPGKSSFITLGFNGGSAPGDFTKFADIVFRGGLVRQVKFHGTAVAGQ